MAQWCSAILLAAVVGSNGWTAEELLSTHQDLAGVWQFQLDPSDVGKKEDWQHRELSEEIRLPGTVVENGFGNPISVDTQFRGHIFHEWFESPRYAAYRKPDNITIPSFLQPPFHYVGAAWYSRKFSVPSEWEEKHIYLFLERCQFETEVWVDGRYCGKQNSLSVPHVFALGVLGSGEHRVVLRIDNRCHIDVGVAHAVNDWIQTNWNGAIGRIELLAKDPVRIDNLQVYPDIHRGSVAFLATIVNQSNRVLECRLEVAIGAISSDYVQTFGGKQVKVVPGLSVVEFTETLNPKPRTWDEFKPTLYRLTLDLACGDWRDRCTAPFAFRELKVQGNRFLLNDRPIMLRGTHDAGLFPLTGYPAMDKASWSKIFERCKQFGLNHMRFHSWCPPEAAFQAADELGIYLQVEGPFNCKLGDGEPVDSYLREEMVRILNTYGNHPSFMFMSHGNEPYGENKDKLLAQEVLYWKQTDPRHLYTAGSGWPMLDENDYHCNHTPRLQLWGEGLHSRINATPPNTMGDYSDLYKTYDRPMVIHEAGQWCVYPNFEEIDKYKGVLKARNFEIFKDFLGQNHMGHLAKAFLHASGRLQFQCYKEEIEHALRTPGCAGFQLLDIRDYSGQGSALVGILDPFWDPKPYVSVGEWRKFCGPTIPLARMVKRVWTNAETMCATVEVAHFGEADLRDAMLMYHVEDGAGNILRQGVLGCYCISVGNGTRVADISIPLTELPVPARYRLAVSIAGTAIRNDWDFWVFSNEIPCEVPSDVLVSRTFDGCALEYLRRGGKVLVVVDPKQLSSPVKIGFSSMFWNVAFTGNQAPHTLGLLCDPKHPLLRNFPTDFHSDWQWWWIIKNSVGLVIDTLPKEIEPIIRPIDNWFYARRLSLLFEARVAGGRLMVSSIDVLDQAANHPEMKQLRRCIFDYMASEAFQPQIEVETEALRKILVPNNPQSVLERLGARIIEVSAETYSAPACNILDSSPDTIWISNKQYLEPFPPHFVVIDIGKIVNIAGVVYIPRQDTSGGRIRHYQIFLSTDLESWGEPVAEGEWKDLGEPQHMIFDHPQKGRFLKIVANDEVHGWPYVSIAGIDIIPEDAVPE